MVSVHGFVEAAQHAVGVGTDSNAEEMCSQAIMPNAVKCPLFLSDFNEI